MNKVAAKAYYEAPSAEKKSPSTRELDALISNIIIKANITKEKNIFFNDAKKINAIDAYPAMIIAASWREITKAFMFTTLVGIGDFAKKIGAAHSPNENFLKVLQTSVAVISDDLNNVFHLFKEQAPEGPGGIHYLWWESAILKPLQNACGINLTNTEIVLPAAKKLTEGMAQLCKDPLGFAVQLRVVEAIALDIVLAFRPLFYAVEKNGQKLFSERSDLNWIYSHITAEVVHNQQVKDEEYGMMLIAQTPEEKHQIIKLSQWYIDLWAGVFDEFAHILHSLPKNPNK